MFALVEPVYAPLLERADDGLRSSLFEALDKRARITLRSYQFAARAAILREWETGNLSTMAAMATGTGKTHLALGTLQAEHEAGRLQRALVLANFQHLIYQPVERIVENWPDLGCPGVVMGELDLPDQRVVVATVQSLVSGDRLERLLVAGPFSHLVIDECHFAVSRTFLHVIERLRDANPALRILGITATPKRTDKVGLRRVFQSVAYKLSIKDAIQIGALVPFMAMAVELPLSLSGVPESGEGWDDEALGDVMSAANALQIIVETWQKHGENRPTVAFTASVRQAHKLAAAFHEAGIPAEAISGETHPTKRRAILNRYERGETKVLCNCFVLTFGWDAPQTACMLNVKPTKSDLVYTQCAGRVLRTHPSKGNALILDFLPQDARDMVLAGDLLGKARTQMKREQKAKHLGIILDIFGIDSEGNGVDADPDRVVLRVLDFLSQRPKMRKLAWVFDGLVATVSVGKGQILALVAPQRDRIERAEAQRDSGKWNELFEAEYQRIRQYHLYHIVDNSRPSLLASTPDEESAYEAAESWADEHAEPWAAKRSRKWRDRPTTLRRQQFAMRLGVWTGDMLDGECSQAISHELGLRALRRAGAIR